jgi:hypothetical protein
MVLGASFIECFGMWRWAEVILIPSNNLAAQSKGSPIGNNSDLYPRWLGTRELLLHDRDPYGAEVTREIQVGFYGRPLDPSNPHDLPFKESFVYPLYVVFLMAPAASLRFGMAVEVFRWVLLLALHLAPLCGCTPSVSAEIVGPQWIGRFLTAVREYPKYAGDPSILQLFLPSSLAKLTAGLLVCILSVLCWRWRETLPPVPVNLAGP